MNHVKEFIQNKNFHLRTIFCATAPLLVKESKKFYNFTEKTFKEKAQNGSEANNGLSEDYELVFDANKEFDKFLTFDSLKVYFLFLNFLISKKGRRLPFIFTNFCSYKNDRR